MLRAWPRPRPPSFSPSLRSRRERPPRAAAPASGLRGNSLGFAQSPRYGHAAWNIDWGPFVPPVPPGMQDGRPHRNGVMSAPDAIATLDMTNVGIAAVATTGDLGPLVVVANYANANTAVGDHYDRFLVGTIWQDLDGDALYDPGEGRSGVLVSTDVAVRFAVTSAGGGYAIPVLAAGAMQVTFSGGGLPTHVAGVTVGDDSVLVDYEVPEPDALGAGVAATLALAARASRRRGTRPYGVTGSSYAALLPSGSNPR